jgi:hypothetical protein
MAAQQVELALKTVDDVGKEEGRMQREMREARDTLGGYFAAAGWPPFTRMRMMTMTETERKRI